MEKLTRKSALIATVIRWYQIHKGKVSYGESRCACCDFNDGSCGECAINESLCIQIVNKERMSAKFKKHVYRELLKTAGFTSMKKFKASIDKKYYKYI